jgi:hypothetical protein
MALAGAVGAGWLATDGAAPRPLRLVPHSTQNFAPGMFAVPQVGQAAASLVPHSRQNFAPLTFSVPQVGQFMGQGSWADKL